MTTHLRSDQFDVLQIIHNKGPILVKDIKDHIPIDQGKIEAAVGTLSNYSLIEKIQLTTYSTNSQKEVLK